MFQVKWGFGPSATIYLALMKVMRENEPICQSAEFPSVKDCNFIPFVSRAIDEACGVIGAPYALLPMGSQIAMYPACLQLVKVGFNIFCFCMM